jgi:spoIIIJ-associated protein
VEWVEITGSTIEEAKEAALDQLGVDTDEAEFEILEEPRQGLFGRTRGEARVRARIRPTRPRPKNERRDRRRKGSSRSSSSSSDSGSAAADADDTDDTGGSEPPPQRTGRRRTSTDDKAAATKEPAVSEQSEQSEQSDRDVDLTAHTAIVSEFVTGLVEAFGAEAAVSIEEIDEENAEVRVEGDDLGLLVGPKGATLSAVQELSRTVVHRRVPGTAAGRVRLDVAGYRQRRREALERFTTSVAEEVRSSGVQKALEPMNPADRKVVHDTVNTIDGVATVSEGEEPRRRVVIVPS